MSQRTGTRRPVQDATARARVIAFVARVLMFRLDSWVDAGNVTRLPRPTPDASRGYSTSRGPAREPARRGADGCSAGGCCRCGVNPTLAVIRKKLRRDGFEPRSGRRGDENVPLSRERSSEHNWNRRLATSAPAPIRGLGPSHSGSKGHCTAVSLTGTERSSGSVSGTGLTIGVGRGPVPGRTQIGLNSSVGRIGPPRSSPQVLGLPNPDHQGRGSRRNHSKAVARLSFAAVVTGDPCPTTSRSNFHSSTRSMLRRAARGSEKAVHRIIRLSATLS